jgi:hypothetical protein
MPIPTGAEIITEVSKKIKPLIWQSADIIVKGTSKESSNIWIEPLNFDKEDPIDFIFRPTIAEIIKSDRHRTDPIIPQLKQTSSNTRRYWGNEWNCKRDIFFRSLYKDIATRLGWEDLPNLPQKRKPIFEKGKAFWVKIKRTYNNQEDPDYEEISNTINDVPYFKWSKRWRAVSEKEILYNPNMHNLFKLTYPENPHGIDWYTVKEKDSEIEHKWVIAITTDYLNYNKGKRYKTATNCIFKKHIVSNLVKQYHTQHPFEQCANPILHYILEKYPDVMKSKLDAVAIVTTIHHYNEFKTKRLDPRSPKFLWVLFERYQRITNKTKKDWKKKETKITRPFNLINELALTHYVSPETMMILLYQGFPMIENRKDPQHHIDVYEDQAYKYCTTSAYHINNKRIPTFPVRIDYKQAVDIIIQDYLTALATPSAPLETASQNQPT